MGGKREREREGSRLYATKTRKDKSARMFGVKELFGRGGGPGIINVSFGFDLINGTERNIDDAVVPVLD